MPMRMLPPRADSAIVRVAHNHKEGTMKQIAAVMTDVSLLASATVHGAGRALATRTRQARPG